jgi:hypothetical protein
MFIYEHLLKEENFMKKAERKKSIKKQVITCAVLAASLLLPISTSADKSIWAEASM